MLGDPEREGGDDDSARGAKGRAGDAEEGDTARTFVPRVGGRRQTYADDDVGGDWEAEDQEDDQVKDQSSLSACLKV